MTSAPELLKQDDAFLLVIDVQEAFRDRVDGFPGLVAAVGTLAAACRLLDVPVVVSEQYPRGLGATVAELDGALAGAERVEKVEFSVAATPGWDDLEARLGRRQAIVCGLEAHVCVHQTASELLARGLAVHLVHDAVASQDAGDREVALARLAGAGARPSTVQMALFELLRSARAPRFREVQSLVKDLAAGAWAGEPVGGAGRAR